ncbi:hypothetical protein HDU96_008820 [Phlyctochytrium bullatum]|nr:hypothetical protein HDU96_008820 [Phlyctochytrium bullatum]
MNRIAPSSRSAPGKQAAAVSPYRPNAEWGSSSQLGSPPPPPHPPPPYTSGLPPNMPRWNFNNPPPPQGFTSPPSSPQIYPDDGQYQQPSYPRNGGPVERERRPTYGDILLKARRAVEAEAAAAAAAGQPPAGSRTANSRSMLPSPRGSSSPMTPVSPGSPRQQALQRPIDPSLALMPPPGTKRTPSMRSSQSSANNNNNHPAEPYGGPSSAGPQRVQAAQTFRGSPYPVHGPLMEREGSQASSGGGSNHSAGHPGSRIRIEPRSKPGPQGYSAFSPPPASAPVAHPQAHLQQHRVSASFQDASGPSNRSSFASNEDVFTQQQQQGVPKQAWQAPPNEAQRPVPAPQEAAPSYTPTTPSFISKLARSRSLPKKAAAPPQQPAQPPPPPPPPRALPPPRPLDPSYTGTAERTRLPAPEIESAAAHRPPPISICIQSRD